MASRVMRVALYECERLAEHLPPSAPASCSSYAALLQSAFDHVRTTSSRLLPHLSLTSFDVKAEKYPAHVSEFDGVLISGSLSGVYDKEPWIQRLLEEIRILDKNKVRTCGISFGHQAIAAALGATVARNPKGSEVSVRTANLTEKGKELFNSNRDSFKLHYHHNDAIIDLPKDFWLLASNNVTQYQALYKPCHLLTFCGHPDYSHQPKALELLLEVDRQKQWVHEQLIDHGLDILHDKTDYQWIVNNILRFYMGALESDH